MGSRGSDPDRSGDEEPQTVVTLTRGFYMSQHEVTQGEYLAVMGNKPSGFGAGDQNSPVETVSWNDATNYCERLTEQERLAGRLAAGWGYRLPTEAEWEYAARAGTTTRFSFGDDLGYTKLGDYAWYGSDGGPGPHRVQTRLPNPWGLYDMHGNVWEWCQNWLGGYPGGKVVDPVGPASGQLRVCRGGSWGFAASWCRSAAHWYGFPDSQNVMLGFRPVLAPRR